MYKSTALEATAVKFLAYKKGGGSMSWQEYKATH